MKVSMIRCFDSVVEAARFRDELEKKSKNSGIRLTGKCMHHQWCYTVHWYREVKD